MSWTGKCVALGASLLLVLALTACASQTATPPSIRGVVTQASEGAGSILVVWSEDLGVSRAEYDAASIRLAEGGVVVIDGRETGIDDLAVGDTVEAWFTGAVAESYPVQAGASRIEKTGTYDGQLPTPPGLESPLEQPE